MRGACGADHERGADRGDPHTAGGQDQGEDRQEPEGLHSSRADGIYTGGAGGQEPVFRCEALRGSARKAESGCGGQGKDPEGDQPVQDDHGIKLGERGGARVYRDAFGTSVEQGFEG